MRPDERLDRIFKEARGAVPDTSRVETGLETRVLARVREIKGRRPWYSLAWRLVPLFTAVTVALGIWYYASAPDPSADMRAAITAEYEDTLSLNILNGG